MGRNYGTPWGAPHYAIHSGRCTKAEYRNLMKKSLILILIIFLYSCPDDDITDEQPILDYSCCSQNPFESINVDNLDQSQGEITFAPFFTPNNDGHKDRWFVRNLHLYSNGSIEIFDSNNQSVYFLSDLNQYPGWNGNNLSEGIYRYKLIIENEQTYLQQGYLCLILSRDTELSTAECDPSDFDPIIDND